MANRDGGQDAAAAISDDDLVDLVAGTLAGVDGIEAVSLGGSRARGTHHPDSDFDFGLYYRGSLDTAAIRALGWPGEVFEPGAWGGGVFNAGAWLTVAGRKVDLIYRDIDDVSHHTAEAEAGRYRVEHLAFYLAGIPTYVVVGEMALQQVLVGSLPRPTYPDALSRAAATRWRTSARLTLEFGRAAHARTGDVVAAAGALARVATEAAHGVMAARREWVLNEKRLISRAGLDHLRAVLAAPGSSPAKLANAFDEVAAAVEEALPDEGRPEPP